MKRPDSAVDTATGYPTIAADALAWISETQMIEVDRAMVDDLGIELKQMMENAGRSLARLVLDRYYPGTVAVVVGSGGNGGGGLVAARHLANAGVAISIVTTRPDYELSNVAAHQFAIADRMGLPVTGEVTAADVVVDAVIGYSLQGAPTGRSAELIGQIRSLRGGGGSASSSDRPQVVSLDTPSGLDVSTGMSPGVVVEADATLTLCLPKSGLRRSRTVGDLYVADISVPPSITAPLGIDDGVAPPCFGPGPVLAVTGR